MAEAKKKKWIKGATENKGALHRHLGIPEGEKIPEEKLRAAASSSNPKVAKEANLAMTLKGFHHKKKEESHNPVSASAARKKMYGKD